MEPTSLRDETVILEPANEDNVELLVRWSLDPTAQGPHKRVPPMTPEELRQLFLTAPDRCYFLIRRTMDGKPLGRFYFRAWHFHSDPEQIDWELNPMIAAPADRGKGYGTAVQSLATEYLLQRQETHSVFAYTFEANTAERRALHKAGFEETGPMPHGYYRVNLPPEPCILYVKRPSGKQGKE